MVSNPWGQAMPMKKTAKILIWTSMQVMSSVWGASVANYSIEIRAIVAQVSKRATQIRCALHELRKVAVSSALRPRNACCLPLCIVWKQRKARHQRERDGTLLHREPERLSQLLLCCAAKRQVTLNLAHRHRRFLRRHGFVVRRVIAQFASRHGQRHM